MTLRSSLLIEMPFWHVDSPHLALPYVGGIFKQAGWRVRIADLNVLLYHAARAGDRWWWDYLQTERIYGLGRKMRDDPFYRGAIKDLLSPLLSVGEYDLIAFTVNYSQADLSLHACRIVKSVLPEVPVLFGGPECFPQATNTDFFRRSGGPDILCQGEAEICLPQFLHEFGSTGDWRTSCRGFVYPVAKKMVDNGPPELPTFRNGFVMPVWKQIEFSQYRRPEEFSSFFSRGCIAKCAFCSESPLQQRHRSRRPEDLLEEIRQALGIIPSSPEVPTVILVDSLINGNMGQLERLCDLLIAARMRLKWIGEARLRPEMTRAFLGKMRDAGCTTLLWGLESASQRVLDSMNKGIDYEIARRIIIDSAEVGIQNLIYLIVGFPGETPEDFVENLMAVRDLRGYSFWIQASVLGLSPGSPLHSDPEKWGVDPGREGHDWISKDRRNDYHVREMRSFIIRNAIWNSSLSLHGAEGLEDILGLDFNRLSLASEIAAVLYELWKMAGADEEMTTFLTEWKGKDIHRKRHGRDELQYWTPASLPRDVSLENWFNRDKNAREQKLKICLKVFAAIRQAYKHAPKAAL